MIEGTKEDFLNDILEYFDRWNVPRPQNLLQPTRSDLIRLEQLLSQLDEGASV